MNILHNSFQVLTSRNNSKNGGVKNPKLTA